MRLSKSFGVIIALAFLAQIRPTTGWSAEAVEGICAIVNDEIITRREVRQRAFPLVVAAQQKLRGDALRRRIDEILYSTRENLIAECLLAQEGERLLDNR